MNKYVYDNHEIHEGIFVILQVIDSLCGKYRESLPSDIEEELNQLIKHLTVYAVPKDKYKEIDFVDNKLIWQYIYDKYEVSKYNN